MSDSKPVITDQEVYLLSRLSDAAVELGRGRLDLAKLELHEADKVAQEIVDAAAKLRADLLEALVRVVDELDWSLLLESDDLPERQQAHAAILQAAESAIAKAKGEQP